MKTIEYDFETEKKLIELFGYNLLEPDNSNRMLIVDKDDNQVGFIQYKKLFKKNIKKNLPATYGYNFVIDSPTISCNIYRKNIDKIEESSDNNFTYEFQIKRENDTDTIEISLGKYPRINLWSKEYGFIDFHIDYEGLYLNYKSNTEKFDVEETLVYKSNNEEYNSEYTYQISYCKKGFDLDSDDQVTTRVIKGVYEPNFQEKNKLNVIETTWIRGKLRTNRNNVVDGTVQEMATKHQMGIDSFNHFRYLINKILPVKKDIISEVVSDEIINKRDLSLFIPDLKRNNTKKLVK